MRVCECVSACASVCDSKRECVCVCVCVYVYVYVYVRECACKVCVPGDWRRIYIYWYSGNIISGCVYAYVRV